MFLLDANNQKPLYGQLYEQIKAEILKGELATDAKLPSSRQLAKDLQISRNTVEMAYQQLYSEGYLLSKPRSGYYVRELDFSFLPIVKNSKEEETTIEETKKKAFQYDFQYGKLLPNKQFIAEWQRISNYCLREYQEEFSNYLTIEGEVGLRRELKKYLQNYRGVECSLDQIIIGAGTQYSISLICQLFLQEKRSIAIESPGFLWAYRVFENFEFPILPMELDEAGLMVDKLKTTEAEFAYVTPSHQFPTGKIMPISRRLELIEWALKQQGLIIEDDYSCHLRYNIKPIPSLQALCPERVIHIGSFSKFLLPSMRVSYMVLPKHLIARFKAMFQGLPSVVSFLTQKSLEVFMQEGNWDSYLRKTTKQYKKRHDALIEALTKEFGDKIAISGMHAGLHLLLQVKWPMGTEELIARAAKQGINILQSSVLWQGREDKVYGRVLLGFGGIDAEDIPQAIKLLRQAWLS